MRQIHITVDTPKWGATAGKVTESWVYMLLPHALRRNTLEDMVCKVIWKYQTSHSRDKPQLLLWGIPSSSSLRSKSGRALARFGVSVILACSLQIRWPKALQRISFWRTQSKGFRIDCWPSILFPHSYIWSTMCLAVRHSLMWSWQSVVHRTKL